MLDDGRITDSQGRTVDFKNTILILTSNLGSDMILNGIENGEITDEAKDAVNTLLKRSFRPEFLNRLDETVFYKPLSKDDISKITELQLNSLRTRLSAHRLTLALTEEAKDFIADAAYDPIYGARPLKRFLQSRVETLIAREMIKKDIAPESTVIVDVKENVLSVSVKDPAPIEA